MSSAGSRLCLSRVVHGKHRRRDVPLRAVGEVEDVPPLRPGGLERAERSRRRLRGQRQLRLEHRHGVARLALLAPLLRGALFSFGALLALLRLLAAPLGEEAALAERARCRRRVFRSRVHQRDGPQRRRDVGDFVFFVVTFFFLLSPCDGRVQRAKQRRAPVRPDVVAVEAHGDETRVLRERLRQRLRRRAPEPRAAQVQRDDGRVSRERFGDRDAPGILQTVTRQDETLDARRVGPRTITHRGRDRNRVRHPEAVRGDVHVHTRRGFQKRRERDRRFRAQRVFGEVHLGQARTCRQRGEYNGAVRVPHVAPAKLDDGEAGWTHDVSAAVFQPTTKRATPDRAQTPGVVREVHRSQRRGGGRRERWRRKGIFCRGRRSGRGKDFPEPVRSDVAGAHGEVDHLRRARDGSRHRARGVVAEARAGDVADARGRDQTFSRLCVGRHAERRARRVVRAPSRGVLGGERLISFLFLFLFGRAGRNRFFLLGSFRVTFGAIPRRIRGPLASVVARKQTRRRRKRLPLAENVVATDSFNAGNVFAGNHA